MKKPSLLDPPTNILCGIIMALPVLALDGPRWAVWSVIGIVYTIHTAADRITHEIAKHSDRPGEGVD